MKLFEKKNAPQLIMIGILIVILILIMDKKNNIISMDKIRGNIKDIGQTIGENVNIDAIKKIDIPDIDIPDINIPDIEKTDLLVPEDKANISNLGSSIANSIGLTQTNVYA